MSTTSTLLLALVATALPATAAPHNGEDHSSTPTNSTSKAYELIADYSGPSFFDNFDTFTGPDPTEGHVNYTDMHFAAQQSLVGFIANAKTNSTSAYLGVDHTNVAPKGRNSVRLTSKDKFNAGSMLVVDVKHAPVQWGVWPAIWLLGSKGIWPSSGESDVLEYVHNATDGNGMTLHTAPGCSVTNQSSAFQGELQEKNCNADQASKGCGVISRGKGLIGNKRFATAGKAFNMEGGAVYVHDWQPNGITVWAFPRAHQPADLAAGHPDPSTWRTKPLAKFAGSGCDFNTAFQEMQLILNIDFCGTWAGQVWGDSGAVHATGAESCEEYVAANPKAFRESYFEIGSVRFYSNNGQTVARAAEGKRDLGVEFRTFDEETFAKERRGNGTYGGDATGDGHHRLPNVTHPHGNLSVVRARVPRAGAHGGALKTSGSSSVGMEAAGWLLAAGTFAIMAFVL